MSSLGVTIAQYAPASTVAENLAAMGPLVTQAQLAGSQLVVFPEYSHAFNPEFGPEWASSAEREDGDFVTGLQALSREHAGIIIVAGMLRSVADAPKPVNTQVAVGPEGILARADKIHLYDAFGASESQWISPGSLGSAEVFACEGFSLGMMACYDLRFPEVSRRLGDAGVDVIITPAQWVPGDNKVHQWDTLLAARAIESQAFVLAADHPMPHGVGHSHAIAPAGVSIGRAGSGPELVHVTLERELVTAARAANPMASARRLGVTPL